MPRAGMPRSGLRIAPLDPEEERPLLPVRIAMEAIACKLAAQRADADHVARLAAAAEARRGGRHTMTLAEFNVVDSQLNAVILSASGGHPPSCQRRSSSRVSGTGPPSGSART